MKSLVNKFCIFIFLTVFTLISFSNLFMFNNTKTVKADSGVNEITVFSWEDYIDEGYDSADDASEYLNSIFTPEELESSVLDIFEEQTGIKVNYQTFATCEEMYNELIKNPNACDLLCPSEYMILQMKSENLIKPYPVPQNYQDYASPYIKSVFEDLGLNIIDNNGDEKAYATGYMWGTMGLLYNASNIEAEELAKWTNLYEEKFSNKITIKDSLRDTYIMAIAIVYEDELYELKSRYEQGSITKAEYKQELTEIFNRTDEKTVNEVQKALIELKDNLYSFEVDAGKNDILTGKIDINFAWSGDAAYAIYEGEEADVELGYVVPETGSNLWFDGWVMAKNANVENSLKFLDFIADPQIAIRNMEYIGYTSCIGGDDVFEYVQDAYDDDGENQVDLKYFFDPEGITGNDYIINSSVVGGQLYAQYADEETIARCVVMQEFQQKDLIRINEMWYKIKLITWPVEVILIIVLGAVLLIAGMVVYRFRNKIFNKTNVNEKAKTNKKGLTEISRTEIK